MIKNRYNWIIIAGIISTMLIHVTWIWGLYSVFLDILANNIGRCGLFLFVLEMGRLIKKCQDKKGLFKKVLIVYLLSFSVYNWNIIVINNQSFNGAILLKKLLLGVDANIWILHGILVFVLSINIISYLNIPEHLTKTVKIIAGGYSVLAFLSFIYANVYQNIFMIDKGIIFKAFIHALGTNRPSIILEIPFLYFGYVSADWKLKKVHLSITIALLFFITWIIEIIALRQHLAMNNVYMTIIGAISTSLLWLCLKSSINLNNKIDYLSLLIFGLQFSVHTFVVWICKINTILEYAILFISYTVVTLLLYFLISRRRQAPNES